jgi:hypothetical protein
LREVKSTHFECREMCGLERALPRPPLTAGRDATVTAMNKTRGTQAEPLPRPLVIFLFAAGGFSVVVVIGILVAGSTA